MFFDFPKLNVFYVRCFLRGRRPYPVAGQGPRATLSEPLSHLHASFIRALAHVFEPGVGIENPPPDTRGCVQCQRSIARGTEKEAVARQNRRGLEGCCPGLAGRILGISGLRRPGNFQAVDIAAVNLIEWRVAGSSRIATGGGPARQSVAFGHDPAIDSAV